jgi:phenylalanyl-tRNA synthetase beta chain
MKINLDWLNEYVDVPETPATIKNDLTMAGLVVESYADVNGSVVLELEVTSNRPDCLSHFGVAREVAALYGRSVREPKRRRKLSIRPERIPYSIEIKDPDLCPRYVGLVMDRIRVGPSPEWMQRRLDSCGMRPVNNIVDITNYVLLEMGHPLHAFDFHRLNQGKIVVSRASAGQKMTTLDGVERELDADMLLINDGEGPVAIAGVMGGLESEITQATRTVLLECAYFNPASVRRTSKKLGLSTEASYRFERGADWDDLVAATGRMCQLIEEIAGGRIAGSMQDVYPAPLQPVRIGLRRSRAERLLGVELRDSHIEETLKKLQFRPARKGKGSWEVTCPSYRADMELEADLIEEVARFHGYQNIPATIPAARQAGQESPVHTFQSAARHLLIGLGYCEAINLSFAASDDERLFEQGHGARAMIRNPLTEETQYLRTSLVPGLIRSARRNFSHDIYDIRLFEIGKVYGRENGKAVERVRLGILGTGNFAGNNWLNPAGNYSYFHLKGVITSLVAGLRGEDVAITTGAGVPWLSPVDASTMSVGQQSVGVLGSLHPALQEELKLRQPVFLAEIDFEELSRHLFRPARYSAVPRFPAVQRDLSLVVPHWVTYGAVRQGILGLNIAELSEIELVDIYEGEKIPAGRLSMTLRFTFQDRERTLTVDRVQAFGDNLLTFLRETFGATQR